MWLKRCPPDQVCDLFLSMFFCWDPTSSKSATSNFLLSNFFFFFVPYHFISHTAVVSSLQKKPSCL
uniref:Uncharacterized protein n=1 Tax=Octopus bimaculoides TaxID=37653 RepID=A0A0L8HL78_OCTBM